MKKIIVIWILYKFVRICLGTIFECDFENEEICLFTQLSISQDTFDWTRISYSTNSSSTGPAAASSGRYYMYIETSSPRRPNDTAIIQTPYLPYRGPACLQFSYHMYGSDIGQLEVYGTRNRLNNIWTLAGNQNNSWHKAYAEFSLNQEYIRFQGTRGKSYAGDIAIDDVRLFNGGCKVDLPFVCGFEESSLCSFQQQTNDDFSWTRQSNSTFTTTTGPTRAYQGSYYMYIETSPSSIRLGHVANITTPPIHASGPACLKFNYHMYGSGIVELRVGCPYSDCFWSKRGNQQNNWHEASINTGVTALELIYFAGYRDGDNRGDIAIDNVRITKGWCGCNHGSWGNDCADVCGHCKDGATCEVGTGHCMKCANYYDPPLCTECMDGFWGENCDKICGHCWNETPCDKLTGACRVCIGGYKPHKCIECRTNTWGYRCSNECGHCKYGYPCNQDNGECHECVNSYTLPLCSECNLLCLNGGTLRECGCVCRNHWTGSNCSVCPISTCPDGEKLNTNMCTCECKGPITQYGCSTLPSQATLISNNDGNMTTGSTLTLACSTCDKGHPLGSVTWVKDGAKYDRTTESFSIDSVNKDDSGRWGCYYSNIAGNGSADWEYITVDLKTNTPTDMLLTDDSNSTIGEVPIIIAIALGTLVVIGILILLTLLGLRYQRRKRKASSAPNEHTVQFHNAGYASDRTKGQVVNTAAHVYEDVTRGSSTNEHSATAAENIPYMDLDQIDIQRSQTRSPDLTVYQNLTLPHQEENDSNPDSE